MTRDELMVHLKKLQDLVNAQALDIDLWSLSVEKDKSFLAISRNHLQRALRDLHEMIEEGIMFHI